MTMWKISLRLLSTPVLIALFLLAPLQAEAGREVHIHHDLEIQFQVDEQQVSGTDILTLPAGIVVWPTAFQLAPHAEILAVKADDQALDFSFRNGLLAIPAPGETVSQLVISYRVRFDDPVPGVTAGIEDPSFGITGTISAAGIFLAESAFWHPVPIGWNGTHRVRATTPGRLIAVTAGRLAAEQRTAQGNTLVWESAFPQAGLALAAGPYQVGRERLGDLQVLTFLSESNSRLAPAYLEACREYLTLYQELFGPYPFAKFAVVENFFPTGYGFPGWTLLGSTVIPLPFILTSSLPHEIAHAWWGNAVLVDYSSGNWAEGLATYVADYLLKERSAPFAAKEYRLKILRDYATLVAPGEDFPLREFRGRTSKVEQAVGYGKAAMVFHMLRRKVGDDAFWRGLRRIAEQETGQRVGWQDLGRHFSTVAEEPLDDFFGQWTGRSGAPRLALVEVEANRTGDGWQVSGKIVQSPLAYRLEIPLLLETTGRPVTEIITIEGQEARFQLSSQAEPLVLTADPRADLFRQLENAEIPVTVNALRASGSPLVILTEAASAAMLQASDHLLRGLQWRTAPKINEQDLTEDDLQGKDLLVIGRPRRTLLQPAWPAGISLQATQFTVDDRTFSNPEDALFLVLPRSGDGNRSAGYFLPLSSAAATLVAGKIPHYGRYSYLVFAAGQNQIKRTWEPKGSLLVHRFQREESP